MTFDRTPEQEQAVVDSIGFESSSIEPVIPEEKNTESLDLTNQVDELFADPAFQKLYLEYIASLINEYQDSLCDPDLRGPNPRNHPIYSLHDVNAIVLNVLKGLYFHPISTLEYLKAQLEGENDRIVSSRVAEYSSLLEKSLEKTKKKSIKRTMATA